MTDVVYTDIDQKTKAVSTPFNRDFVNELKSRVSGARWNPNRWQWTYPADVHHIVETIVNQYFGTRERRRLTFDLRYAESVIIDGVEAIIVTPEGWRKGSGVTVVEEDISISVVRHYSAVSGTLVIELDMRAEAEISPSPVKVERVVNGEVFAVSGMEPGLSTATIETLLERMTDEQRAAVRRACFDILGEEEPEPLESKGAWSIETTQKSAHLQVSTIAHPQMEWSIPLDKPVEPEVAATIVKYLNTFAWWREAEREIYYTTRGGRAVSLRLLEKAGEALND